jgi:hypothetical protein
MSVEGGLHTHDCGGGVSLTYNDLDVLRDLCPHFLDLRLSILIMSAADNLKQYLRKGIGKSCLKGSRFKAIDRN